MVEIAGRGPGVAARTTVGQLLEQWFTIASTSWSPTTVRQTRSVVNGQLHPHLGGVLVADLTTEQIDHFYTVLLARGGVSGQPLKAGTVQRVHVVLRAALAQAMRWGWIWDNPAERARRIVVVSREPEPPTTNELVTLLEHLRDHDMLFHTFVIVAAVTGARRAQLLALRWRDVNLTIGQVAFSNGWVEGPAGPVLTATKSKRRHTVELDQPTVDLLARQRHSLGDQCRLDSFVFATPDESAWKPNWTTKAFQRHLTVAGLRPFRLHDLRHFVATQMLLTGVPLPIVSRRLGHRRISTPAGDRFAATGHLPVGRTVVMTLEGTAVPTSRVGCS